MAILLWWVQLYHSCADDEVLTSDIQHHLVIIKENRQLVKWLWLRWDITQHTMLQSSSNVDIWILEICLVPPIHFLLASLLLFTLLQQHFVWPCTWLRSWWQLRFGPLQYHCTYCSALFLIRSVTLSNTAAADAPITRERERGKRMMKELDTSLCKSSKLLMITLKTKLLPSDNAIRLCCLRGLLWAPQQRDEFMGLGWDLPLKMKSSSCGEEICPHSLCQCTHVCGECVRAWVMSVPERPLIFCTGESQWNLVYWSATPVGICWFKKKERCTVRQTDSAVSEREGGEGWVRQMH